MQPRNPRPRTIARISLQLSIVHCALFILAAACVSPTSTPTQPAPGPTATPTSVLANSTALPASTPSETAQVLRLWLPPQFAPDESTPSGKVLLAQLAAFEESSGWRVEVRVKKLAGQGGLLDHLRTSLTVAPSVSPDVIALDSVMLAAAADTIQPLTTISDAEVSDYYPFATNAARVNDTLMALPFAADALGYAYSTSAYTLTPQSWADLDIESGLVWLPLNDPTALITLQQYVALGGALTDETGQPTLNAPLLAQVLADYQVMQGASLLPVDVLAAANLDASWTAYRDGRATGAAALFSQYLADRSRVTATSFTFIPVRGGNRATFARQWNYALVAVDPTRQAAALDLMRWLTAPDNVGAWTLAANVLPARAQALNAWSDTTLATAADRLLNAAQPEPAPSVLSVVGPPVTAAVQAVLNGQASPESAAATAATTIANK